jgi:hypothetical protein
VSSGEKIRERGVVYALTTPQGNPFYVGATMQRPRERVNQHLRDARSGRKASQVHELLRETRRCGFWILEGEVPEADLGKRERHHKRSLERAGFQLANYHHGANGCNRQPAAVRSRISAYARKRPRGPKGEFLPALPAIAGASLTPVEAFWITPAND